MVLTTIWFILLRIFCLELFWLVSVLMSIKSADGLTFGLHTRKEGIMKWTFFIGTMAATTVFQCSMPVYSQTENVPEPVPQLKLPEIPKVVPQTPTVTQDESGNENLIMNMKSPDGKRFTFKLTQEEFKAGLVKAVQSGLLSEEDAAKALSFIEDQRVLRQQFDFIQETQRQMAGSFGAVVM
jgi:hypothetical protein